jgi:hypothetical protein
MDPVLGSYALQMFVNNVHAFAVTLFFRRLHIIPYPPVIFSHTVAIFNAGIIVDAKPEVDFANIAPLVYDGIYGLLKQVVPLARCERYHNLAIFGTPVLEVVRRVPSKIRPI